MPNNGCKRGFIRDGETDALCAQTPFSRTYLLASQRPRIPLAHASQDSYILTLAPEQDLKLNNALDKMALLSLPPELLDSIIGFTLLDGLENFALT